MEGAAQTVLGNVGQLVGKEFWQLAAVGGEVAELRDELATMNSLLRMQTEAEEGAVDHFVREWMKQVRELAYDAEDCIDLYVFRIKCRPRDGFLVWSKRLFATLFPRRRLAGDIKALRARAVTISERHARYGVSREALRRPPSLAPLVAAAASASAQALRHANDPGHFVGMQGQANSLAEKVNAVNDEEGDHKLKVFSIVGFGGLGKTTLALEVCRQLETEFDRQAQVSVSQAFDSRKDLKGLLQRLLQQMVRSKAANEKGINEEEEDPVGNIDAMDVDELASTLKDLLEDKRYLVVIDDVWTIAAWDAISSKLPDSKHGSRIIVTTRIETVAKDCSDASVCKDYIYRIKPLNLEDSKKLFLSRAFGSIDASCPKELKVTMDKILNKCAGLPLAIVSIASLLANYRSPESKDMWETICRSIGSQMESNPTLEGMCQILTLSYNHLPYHLKGCTMYLSIFLEDYEISTNTLLYRWIAEGLVEEKRGLTPLEVAEAYFDELINRSMIVPASSVGYNGRIEACRVHDMMLEVIVSKSLEANFVSLVGGQYEGMSYDRIRRLSIHGIEEEHGKMSRMERMDVQHVRSLSMFDLQGQTLLDRLGEFTLLRVLDLEGCKGLENKHVLHICRMYLLRFLSLNGTDISVLPQKVGELEHLQMLDVGQTCLDELPETITKLEKLEHVHFRNKHAWYVMWTPPKGLCKMKALREVNYMIVEDAQVAKEIGELAQLRDIGIWVQSPEPEEPEFSENQKVLKELAISLSKIYSLRCLKIGRFGQGPEALNFLLDLPSPPRLLRKLDIDGGINELPSWVGSLAFLTEIRIMWARLVDDQVYSVLCKLPNLQKIWLGPFSYIGKELVARTTHNFPVLRILDVCSREDTIRFEKGSMDKLEELKVAFGDNRGKMISGVEHLTNLKEVVLTGKKDNPALSRALDDLKAESQRRLQSNHFEFTVGGMYQ